MRHTAAFRYQFPVTAYVTPLVFQNPPAPADIQEKILATDGEVPDYYRVVEAFAFHFDSRIFTGKLIFLFQVNHDFTTAFLRHAVLLTVSMCRSWLLKLYRKCA